MCDDQLPLFPLPNDVSVPRMRPKPRSPDRARYAKARLKRRTLCDDCVRDIHERGPAVAPLPRAVSWRRVDPAGRIDLLCDAHYRVRRNQ